MTRFANLSDHDFELLTADLLGKVLGRRFETFPRGPDRGVDLRSRTPSLHIVQCKHYERSDFRTLERAAKRERAALATMEVRPDRYTFVTSRPLTAKNKDRLVAALRPYVRDTDDVLGADDLDGFLRAHPEVERSHVKLWLGSVTPLQQITHADVVARSAALLADVRATLPRYVQTRSFGTAAQLLGEHHVVLVAGSPGVGKTTLARLLLLDAAERGFVPYSVQSDIGEAWKLLREDEHQVFYFDDFLGRTTLFDGVSPDSRDLVSFVKHVRRSDTTRLILTTREYVLQRAQHEIEELQWVELDADKYSLTLKDYSRVDRARIFYNHIYFNDQVTEAARNDLIRRQGYLAVVDHPSYSPRLIEWMTGLGGHTLATADLDDYTAFCLGVLDNPDRLWSHAYDHGLTDDARRLLLLLPGMEKVVHLDDLEGAFLRSAEQAGAFTGRRPFERALKLLEGSFLRIHRYGDRQEVAALNPSVIDFAKQRLLEDPRVLRAAIEAADQFDQARTLGTLWREHGSPLLETTTVALGQALNATILKPMSPSRRSARDARDQEASDLSSRARTLARLVEQNAGLLPSLTVLDELDQRLIAAAGHVGPDTLWDFVSALKPMRKAGLPYHALAEALRDRALARLGERALGFEPSTFRALATLRREHGGLFTTETWREVLLRFSREVDAIMDRPGEWFASDADLADLARLARDIGLPLRPDDLRLAQGRIRTKVSRRAPSGPRDWVETDAGRMQAGRGPGRAGTDEDQAIGGMFSSFET